MLSSSILYFRNHTPFCIVNVCAVHLCIFVHMGSMCAWECVWTLVPVLEVDAEYFVSLLCIYWGRVSHRTMGFASSACLGNTLSLEIPCPCLPCARISGTCLAVWYALLGSKFLLFCLPRQYFVLWPICPAPYHIYFKLIFPWIHNAIKGLFDPIWVFSLDVSWEQMIANVDIPFFSGWISAIIPSGYKEATSIKQCHGGLFLLCFFTGSCSHSSLKLRPICLGMVLPTLGWTFSHQSSVKESLTDMATG